MSIEIYVQNENKCTHACLSSQYENMWNKKFETEKNFKPTKSTCEFYNNKWRKKKREVKWR